MGTESKNTETRVTNTINPQPKPTRQAESFFSDPSLNPSSFYYLHPGENPSLVLVAELLSGNNYHSWSREFTRALRAKNKQVFLDGFLPIPDPTDPNRAAWDRCNTIKTNLPL